MFEADCCHFQSCFEVPTLQYIVDYEKDKGIQTAS